MGKWVLEGAGTRTLLVKRAWIRGYEVKELYCKVEVVFA